MYSQCWANVMQTILKDVVNQEGLKKKKKMIVKEKGWSVKLRHRENDGRVEMARARVALCRTNNIETGNTLVLEFTRPNVVALHIFREMDLQVKSTQKY